MRICSPATASRPTPSDLDDPLCARGRARHRCARPGRPAPHPHCDRTACGRPAFCRKRQGAALRHPDRGSLGQGTRGHLGPVRHGAGDLDHAGGADEGRAGASGPAFLCRLGRAAEVSPLRQGGAPDTLVFPNAKPGKSISDTSLTAVLRRMGRNGLTAHGFRSTFRDWCAEATNYPRDVAEAALAHLNRDRVEAAYAGGDLLTKRMQMINSLAIHCASPALARIIHDGAAQGFTA